MARLKSGILGPIVGKLANLVGYIRLGKPVVRMRPNVTSKKKKPRTNAQKAVNLRFKIVKSFIADVSDFINVGFRQDVAGTTKIPENGAVSYNLKHAVVGQYPDLSLDYSKVLLCKGKLAGPKNASAALEGEILKFKWEVSTNWGSRDRRNQVMVLAYYPVSKKANYWLSGARISEGVEQIQVRTQETPSRNKLVDEYLEAYIAFISDDRQQVSDSVYLGRIAV